jgi:hypothetical protein
LKLPPCAPPPSPAPMPKNNLDLFDTELLVPPAKIAELNNNNIKDKIELILVINFSYISMAQ